MPLLGSSGHAHEDVSLTPALVNLVRMEFPGHAHKDVSLTPALVNLVRMEFPGHAHNDVRMALGLVGPRMDRGAWCLTRQVVIGSCWAFVREVDMLSRRQFLGSSSVGTLAAVGGCLPPLLQSAAPGAEWQDDGLQNLARQKASKDRVLGYPINMNRPPESFFEWRSELFNAGVGEFAFNNVGNPFKTSPIPFNTHDFERNLIRHYGKLFGFPAEDTWGFLSNSGTDSNMHGMYVGRTLLKERSGRFPKAYFTQEAHYSVQILRDLLGLETVIVETLPDGGMDAEDLGRKLAANDCVPALVVATVGTTFKGAIDDVDAIKSRLAGYEAYLHVDAALFGGYLPFTPHRSVVSFMTDEGGSSAL